jgi:BirA family transcriptional regulator, biotin operon repressor / biotin---[acetyl-CoA-carboxylase] ligase
LGADTSVGWNHHSCGHLARDCFALIRFLASTGSTNADLLADAAVGEGAEGDWLVARRQTAGRGRQGRHWDSPEGNFHGSTLVHLRQYDPPAATLSLVVGVALHRAVAGLCPDLSAMQLKWPNDLLVGPAKLGGILLERSGHAVVCGIGVNLGWAPDLPDRATVSLANMGHPIVVDQFAECLAQCFTRAVADWRSQPLADLRANWLARAHPLGTMLSHHDPLGKRLTGCFDGLEDDGSIRLRAPDGALIIINSGEVMLG